MNQLPCGGDRLAQQTLQHLRTLHGDSWNDLAIEGFAIEWLFTLMKLRDGSQGLAMNYLMTGIEEQPLTPPEAAAYYAELYENMEKGDSLLLEFLCGDTATPDLLKRSLMWALLSALSHRFITVKELNDRQFPVRRGRLPLLEAGADQGPVCVVGFGGYFAEAVQRPEIPAVCCVDLNLKREDHKAFYEKQLERMQTPAGKTVELSDGSDVEQRIAAARTVCITGSALSNGTMAGLLEMAQGKTVIVEGETAAILPDALFANGADYVVQSVVDLDLLETMRRFHGQIRRYELRMSFNDYLATLMPTRQTIAPAGSSVKWENNTTKVGV